MLNVVLSSGENVDYLGDSDRNPSTHSTIFGSSRSFFNGV